MAMQLLSVPRATPPHLATLAASLTPLLSPANAGGFHLRYQGGAVVIEQADFTNVNTAAVQAAVAAAPADSDVLNAKETIDELPVWMRAFFLTLVDQINVLRTQPSTTFVAVTPAQAWSAVKAKIDTL
jgi:hypothetical protein